MTKDNFVDIISSMVHERAKHGFKEVMEKFFESNVVIPKGKNPHKYQDELHKLAEGIYNCECKIELLRPSNIEQVTLKFNVKASDPIFEYQWLVPQVHGYIVSDNGRFMVYDETCEGMIPIEATKRERKL